MSERRHRAAALKSGRGQTAVSDPPPWSKALERRSMGLPPSAAELGMQLMRPGVRASGGCVFELVFGSGSGSAALGLRVCGLAPGVRVMLVMLGMLLGAAFHTASCCETLEKHVKMKGVYCKRGWVCVRERACVPECVLARACLRACERAGGEGDMAK